jgi:threonine dehydratase
MRRLAVDVKQVVEPSGAVALAGLARLAADGAPLPSDVGLIISGGNVDLDRWRELVGPA